MKRPALARFQACVSASTSDSAALGYWLRLERLLPRQLDIRKAMSVKAQKQTATALLPPWRPYRCGRCRVITDQAGGLMIILDAVPCPHDDAPLDRPPIAHNL